MTTDQPRPSLPLSDRRSYRRGVILGLTVAEFFLLLSFVLVLSLALFLARQSGDRAALKEMQRMLVDAGSQDSVRDVLKRISALEEAVQSRDERIAALLAEKEEARPLLEATAGMDKKEIDDFVELVRGIAAKKRNGEITADDIARIAKNADLVDTVRSITDSWQDSNRRIGQALKGEFGKDLSRWNAEIDDDGSVFRFLSPDVLFDQGRASLTPAFKGTLADFCPRFLRLLNERRDAIAEIRIEGHTSSEWRQSTPAREAYFLNMGLSQERTRSVLEYCLGLRDIAPVEGWARHMLVAVGMSSSRPVLDRGGAEESDRSRRVEFRVVTDAEARIGEIAQQLSR
ncbi:OmpA family protein [Mycobacterium sp. KBS0706]|uniref:OmpA family protein n=1 Tax=Mycobacterium sp. KBS0706 TaxID=2578109 RepID=UPI00110FF75A|nr:OmpA family protein [Mycobacterium sp. KBS0706]TSD84975.1 OmpA family protein [Mycobacterium sp. KBS0706]